MDGMQGDLIAKYRAGRVVGSFDHEGLARLVAEAAAAPADFAELGRNGREFARRQLLLEDILQRYQKRIEEVAQGRGHTASAINLV